MRLTHQFEHFEPLTGELPDPYAVMFFESVHRARSLLNGRISEQIKQATLVINGILYPRVRTAPPVFFL